MRRRYAAERTPKPLESRMAGLVAAQHGVFSRGQALDVGVSRSTIQRRLASGRWELVHPQVIREPGAPASWHQKLSAAWLAFDERAIISHRAAAALWNLSGFEPGIVEVKLPSTVRRRVEGVLQHRPQIIDPADVTHIGPLAVTTVARTLIDLASVVPQDAVEEALDDALRRGLVTIPRLRARIAAAGRLTGIHVIRSLVEARSTGSSVPESVFETKLLRLLRRSNVPPPAPQYGVWNGGRVVAVVDFAYPDVRLAIEADGYRWHSGKQPWERDLRRRNQLMALGWRILHVTWSELSDHPERVVRSVEDALAGPR